MNRSTSLTGGVLALVILAAIGMVSFWIRQPLLFPALGPILFVQLQTPEQPAAKPWNVLVGNAVAMVAAVFALAVMGAMHTPPPIVSGVLTRPRELASALAVALTFIGQYPLRATHAPGATTALLITLGAINPEWRAIGIICSGVVLITLLGEGAKQLIKAQGRRSVNKPTPGRAPAE
jgi:CBS-domain-containing membrane protein